MENVWDYPRPPALERVSRRLRIVFGGRAIAETDAGFRVLETSHPPVYYLPREAFFSCTLEPATGRSMCEWKGVAEYWSIRAGENWHPARPGATRRQRPASPPSATTWPCTPA